MNDAACFRVGGLETRRAGPSFGAPARRGWPGVGRDTAGSRGTLRRVALLAFVTMGALFAGGCVEPPPKFTPVHLASGHDIHFQGTTREVFPGRGPALVFAYATDVPHGDARALRKEADEVWSGFQQDVEKEPLTRGAIRVYWLDQRGHILLRQTRTLIYERQADGTWLCLDDE